VKKGRLVGISCALLSVVLFSSFIVASRLDLSARLNLMDLAAVLFGISQASGSSRSEWSSLPTAAAGRRHSAPQVRLHDAPDLHPGPGEEHALVCLRQAESRTGFLAVTPGHAKRLAGGASSSTYDGRGRSRNFVGAAVRG
jgi:hypothetical protein